MFSLYMYYFAYGANLDTNYLAKYIDTENIHIVGSAYIDNYIFRYRNVTPTEKKNETSFLTMM